MNKNAKKWVEALRSGKYEQGKMALRHENRFCCLGVACEVFIENGGAIKIAIDPDGDATYAGLACRLPKEVSDWIGIKSPLGRFEEKASLSSLNDNGSTFFEIADIIESEPKGLFV